jgi:hypothetical protein
MCTVVWTWTWRTTPRSDEALAFTRCSVLKVRAQHDDPSKWKTLAQGAAPTGYRNSLSAGVNLR